MRDVEIAVIGAGIAGIATAHYLAVRYRRARLLIIDMGQPMTLTSARSGENYRNWWPHPVMTAFTDHSTELMEDIARRTGNRIRMTRRGYVLATREARPETLLRQLHAGYGASASSSIRVHDGTSSTVYRPPDSGDWETAPGGVDVLLDRALIRKHYPAFDPEIATLLHIRRAGDISGQQLGQYMLEEIRAAGGQFLQARVTTIDSHHRFTIEADADGTRDTIRADIVVNAAGPFASHVSALCGEELPIVNVLQQKIAFPDRQAAISRRMPFAIDLDGQTLGWTADERDTLASDPAVDWLLQPMPGGLHCRPDGGEHGQWIKLGWAYNSKSSEPTRDPELDSNFPEVVLRGVSRLLPALRTYIGKLPRERVHYGGYYPMTTENWPLVGGTRTPGMFVVGALSGYGTMSACAAGELCARTIMDESLPAFAGSLSLARYQDQPLMAELRRAKSRGVL